MLINIIADATKPREQKQTMSGIARAMARTMTVAAQVFSCLFTFA